MTRVAALDTAVGRSAVEGYQRLTIGEVLADLPDLSVGELLLIASFETAGECRDEVLTRIRGLLGASNPRLVAIPAEPETPPPAAPPEVKPDQLRYQSMLDVIGAPSERGLSPSGTPADPLVDAPAHRRRPPRALRLANPPHPARPPLPLAVGPRPRDRRLGSDPRPRDRRLSSRSITILAGMVVAAGICGAGVTHLLGRTGTAPERASFSRNAEGTPGVAGDASSPRLVAGVTGYSLQPPGGSQPDQSDLAKAAADDGGPDAQTALTTGGFMHGYQRLWTNAARQQIVLFVYRFNDTSGATTYERRWIDADRAALKGAATNFTVPRVPGSIGLHSVAGRARAAALFVRDRYVVRVIVTLPASANETALAQQLALKQYGLL